MDKPGIAGGPRSGRIFVAAAVGGLTLCLASLLASGERPAGTGTYHWRGFPRSYAFSWYDLAGEQARSGMNAFYFLQNWLFWTAAAAGLILLLRWLRRARAA